MLASEGSIVQLFTRACVNNICIDTPKVGANVQINNQMTKPLARHFFADVNKLFAL